MRTLRVLATPLVALALAGCASSGGPWIAETPAVAYRDGYDLGHRAGSDDGRRGEPCRYTDEIAYQRGGDSRWSRDRSDSFREGFATGYRDGYQSAVYTNSRGPNTRPQARGGRGAWRDPAVNTGYADGYEAGVDDGQAGRAFEPVRERGYREADRGYERSYGAREIYQANYRDGFRIGYDDGYRQATGRR